jgi:ribosomal protein S6E (S10)
MDDSEPVRNKKNPDWQNQSGFESTRGGQRRQPSIQWSQYTDDLLQCNMFAVLFAIF